METVNRYRSVNSESFDQLSRAGRLHPERRNGFLFRLAYIEQIRQFHGAQHLAHFGREWP